MPKIILESYWKMLLDVHMCTLITSERIVYRNGIWSLSAMHVWKKHVPKICNNSKEKYKRYKEYYYYDTITACISQQAEYSWKRLYCNYRIRIININAHTFAYVCSQRKSKLFFFIYIYISNVYNAMYG